MSYNYNTVIYHRDLDGFAAAFAAWKVLGNSAQYISIQYGEPIPDLAGKNVLVVDFSFKRDAMKRLVEETEAIQIVDHHRSVSFEFPDGHPNIFLDQSKSGAVLAWEWFFPNEELPYAFELVQDADLWRNELPETDAFKFAIEFDLEAENFPIFEEIIGEGFETALAKGQAVANWIDKQIANDVRKSYKIRLKQTGDIFWAFNGFTPWLSKLGNQLAQKEELGKGLMFIFNGEKTIVSMRSVGAHDVGLVAKEYGGGGHKYAAGFEWTKPLEELFEVVEE